MSKPYVQKIVDGKIIRKFDKNVNPDELEWHQDKMNRHVRVLEGKNWQVQFDASLPMRLDVGETYYIPSKTWHRALRGEGDLIIEITEF